MGQWQNYHADCALMAQGKAVLVVAGAAVVLRVGYAVNLAWFSNYEWLGARYGPDMRLTAIANLVLMTVVVAAFVAGKPRLAWLAFAGALATTAMLGAGEGFLSAQLLPWVTATTTAAMLVIAGRSGRTDLMVAAAILPVIVGIVVYREAWASLGYAVAALTVLLACSSVMLLRSASTDRRAGSPSSPDERRFGQDGMI
jgi:hypothetical protein